MRYHLNILFYFWSYDPVVRIPDFESGCPGSNPGMTFLSWHIFPSGQRGESQDLVLRLRGFESHYVQFSYLGLVSKGDPFKIIQITCFIRRFLTKLHSDFYEKLS